MHGASAWCQWTVQVHGASVNGIDIDIEIDIVIGIGIGNDIGIIGIGIEIDIAISSLSLAVHGRCEQVNGVSAWCK